MPAVVQSSAPMLAANVGANMMTATEQKSSRAAMSVFSRSEL